MDTAFIVKDDVSAKTVVVKCPFCSKKHKHGYGGSASPDRLVRGADCAKIGGKREYVLVK